MLGWIFFCAASQLFYSHTHTHTHIHCHCMGWRRNYMTACESGLPRSYRKLIEGAWVQTKQNNTVHAEQTIHYIEQTLDIRQHGPLSYQQEILRICSWQ